MTPQLDEAEQLLGAAERDVVAFQILAANAAAPPEIVLFHAQQAVEKFIKAVFAAQGLVYPRTHDLLLLWQTANEQGLAIPAEFELLARLGPYAVEFRYLGAAVPDVSIVEAEALIAKLRPWSAAHVGKLQ
jgi:HEPN domain-containing protein